MTRITAQGLTVLCTQINAAEVPWGVFAGAAVGVYGPPRPLNDIDILIPSDAGERLSAFLPEAALGYDQDGRVSELRLPDCEIIAGLTENISLEMDAPMIARLTQGQVLGVEMPVLSLEDNLVFKVVLGRGPEVGKHDWADAAAMMVSAPQIDWDYLCWRLETCVPVHAPALLARLRALTNDGGVYPEH